MLHSRIAMGGRGPISDDGRYRFGPFDLDTRSGELRKHGVRIQLQNQPFQILTLLVGRSGEIVPRVEIQSLLWPDNTNVEFDHGINAAIRRLRVALGDSAEEPQYIETVARRGYRFLVTVVRECHPVQPEIAADVSIPAPDSGVGEVPAQPLTVPRPGTPDVEQAAAKTRGPGGVSRTAYRLSAAALVIAALAAVSILSLRAPLRPLNGTSIVSTPPGFSIVGRPVLSPDGSQLVAALEDAARHRRLWVLSLGTGTSRFLRDTEGASGPFWAPDGLALGFVAGNEFKRISLNSGLVSRIYAAISSAPGAWGADGTIIYCPGPRMPLFVLETEHGTVPATRKEPGETLGHISPHFVDDKRFVFLAPSPMPQKSTVYIASLGSFDRQPLLTDATEIGYAPPDNLLYLRDGVLLTRRFDFSRGTPLGQERQVQLGISGQRVSTFSVSRNGTLVVQLAPRHPESDLVWRTREGNITGFVGRPAVRWQVTLAPDESAAAINMPSLAGSARLELLRFGTPAVNLTGDSQHVLDAVWSPDSRSIAYQIYGREKTVIMIRRLDQPEPRVLLDDGFSNYPDDWSPDGKWILCRRTANIIFTIAPDGTDRPHMLLNGDHILDQLKFSPDGKWIAYNSDASGRAEVYVTRFPQMDHLRQISQDGGCQPLWRKDGKELFYLDPDGKLFSVAFPQGPGSKPSTPRMLFQSAVVVNSIISQYAVTGDGNRFLMLELHKTSERDSSDGPLVLVKNWAARQ